MSEPKPELKAGDSLDFIVSDKTLTVEPLPYGNLKKILRIAFGIAKDISAGELTTVPDLMDKYMAQVLPLLFRGEKYNFVTTGWIDDNLTVPVIRRIVEAAVVVNGLKDFFDKAGLSTNGKVPSAPPIPMIPAESSGSTTSAGSPTDGGPKT
jgi:hypothetical protein